MSSETDFEGCVGNLEKEHALGVDQIASAKSQFVTEYTKSEQVIKDRARRDTNRRIRGEERKAK